MKRKLLSWILILIFLLPYGAASAVIDAEQGILIDPYAPESTPEPDDIHLDPYIINPYEILEGGVGGHEPAPDEAAAPAQEPRAEDEALIPIELEGVFQEGDLFGEQIVKKPGFGLFSLLPNTMEQLQAAILGAIEDMHPDVNISGLAIPVTEIEDVKAAVAAVINSNPQLFYWNSTELKLYATTGENQVLTRIAFNYHEGALEMKQAYELEAGRIIDTFISDGMSDTQKALALHDALALHVRYHIEALEHSTNNTQTPYINPYPTAYNAYGAVVEKHAVCQGYALAYIDLLKRVGVDSLFVPSVSMNHAWNLVHIKTAGVSGWYHVDVTHDDPMYSASPDGNGDLDGAVTHKNLLASQSEIALSHNGHTIPDGVSVSTVSHGQKALWSGVETGMFYAGGKWFTSDINPPYQYGYNYGRLRGNLVLAELSGAKSTQILQITPPVRDGNRLYFFKYESESSLAGNLNYYDMLTGETGVELVIEAGRHVAELYAPGNGRLYARLNDIETSSIGQDRMHIIGSTYGASYTIAIDGILRVGETLAAATENAPSGIAYRWLRCDDAYGENETIIEGEAGASYVLKAADAGKYIKAEAYVQGVQGMAESLRLGPVAKAGQALSPPPPELLVKTDTTVTLQTIQGAEYAYGKNSDAPQSGWQAGAQFTGLESNETYYFFARYHETELEGAGPASAASEAITTYAQIYRIAVTPPPEGSAVRVNVRGVEVDRAPVGESIQIAAIADKGHYFTGWSSIPNVAFADALELSTSFDMPNSDVTLTASFLEKAQPVIVLSALEFDYDNTVKQATLSASAFIGYADEQAFLDDVLLTYDGQTDAPKQAGSYEVTAVYAGNEKNKATYATGTLIINSIQHDTPQAPSVDGANTTQTTIAHASYVGYKYLLLPSTDAAPTYSTEGWRDGTGGMLTWAGLKQGCEYKLYTYIAKDRDHTASEVSAPASVSTGHIWALAANPPIAALFASISEPPQDITISITNMGTGAVESLALTKSGDDANIFMLGEISPASLGPGESAEFTVSATAQGTSGVYTADITLSSQKAGGAGAMDSLSIPLTFTVENKELITLTGLNAKEVDYDGTPKVFDITGLTEQNDSIDLASIGLEHSYAGISASGATYTASSTPPTDAGSYTFTISVPDTDDSYMGSLSASLIIKPKALSIEGMTVAPKPYDGTLGVSVVGGALSGVVSGDLADVQLGTIPTTGEFNTMHSGEGKPVYIDAIALTGARAFNYTLIQPTLTGTITPRIVTPVVTVSTRVYDGTDMVTSLTVDFSPNDILLGDYLSIAYIGSTYADKNVGNDKQVMLGTRMVTGNDYNDYEIKDPTGIKGDITPHFVTVAVSGASSYEYDGKAKTLTATYAALGDDTPSVTLLYNGLPVAPVKAGTYIVTVELDDPNYVLDKTVFSDGIASGPRLISIARGKITANNITKNMRFDELATVTLGKLDFDIRPLTPGAVPPDGAFELLGADDVNGLISASPQVGATVSFGLVNTLSAADAGKSAVIRLRFNPVSDTYDALDVQITINIVGESSTSVVTGAPVTVNLGEAMDISALKLVTTMQDGTVYTLKSPDLIITGYTPDLPPYSKTMLRAYTLTVTDPLNPQRSASFTVQVIDVVENIIVTPPQKTQYQWLLDTSFNLTGGKVELVMRSGDNSDTPITPDMLNRTAAILETLGSYSVGVTYKGKTFSNAFTIVVERKEPLSQAPAPGQPGVSALNAGTIIKTDGLQTDISNIILRIRAILAGEETLINQSIAASSQFAGIPQANILLLDIDLWDVIKDRAAALTSGSITVQLPYPKGTDSLDTFYILHRKSNGASELYTPSKSASGLTFTVTSFSPFAVGWIKNIPSGGDNNGWYYDYARDGWYYNAQGGWDGYVPAAATQLRQQAFWDAVLDAILTAKSGSTIRVNARGYDQMPTDIMHALSDTNVTLIVNWDGGESIRITSKTAPKPEAGRNYYPLSLLAQEYPYQASGSSSSGSSSGSSSSSSSSGSSSGSSSSGSSSGSSSSGSSSGSSSSGSSTGTSNSDNMADTDAVQAASSGMSEMVDLDAPLVEEDLRDEYTPPTGGMESSLQDEEAIHIEPPAYAQQTGEDDGEGSNGADAAHWLLFACILLLLGAVGVVFRYLIKKKRTA